MDNTEIKALLRNAAYTLISSFTARKAFIENVDALDDDNTTPFADYFSDQAAKIRSEELKKLKERLAMYGAE